MRCQNFKGHFLAFAFLTISSLCYGQHDKMDPQNTRNYLLSRKFSFYMGVPTEYHGNIEVHGYTDVEREIEFINNSTFQEVIIFDNSMYDFHIPIDSSFMPFKRGFEISIIKGIWQFQNDTLILNYKEESIYDISEYINFRYYKDRAVYDKEISKEQVNLPPALRSRIWKETKKMKLDKEKQLCIIDGLNWCFSPSY